VITVFGSEGANKYAKSRDLRKSSSSGFLNLSIFHCYIFTPWEEALDLPKMNDWSRFVSMQHKYNLIILKKILP